MTETADTASSADEMPDAPELPKMSFLDHLEELRKRLIVSIIAVGVAFIACWNWADKIYAWVQAPLTKFLPVGDQKLAST
jgi:sec-independent protein translocase protein TatC